MVKKFDPIDVVEKNDPIVETLFIVIYLFSTYLIGCSVTPVEAVFVRNKCVYDKFNSMGKGDY